jgi:hypothetical protein
MSWRLVSGFGMREGAPPAGHGARHSPATRRQQAGAWGAPGRWCASSVGGPGLAGGGGPLRQYFGPDREGWPCISFPFY